VEELLFPDFFQSPQGELALRSEFETFRTTKLCSVDMGKLFEQHPSIGSFLTNLTTPRT
jgi:hypothetical protein